MQSPIKRKAILLLSGGLDSVANLYFAAHSGEYEIVQCLTVNYGQKAFLKEYKAAKKFTHHFKVAHQIIDLSHIGCFGNNALTSDLQLPQIQSHQLDDLDATTLSASQVWVPNRNGVLIHLAASFAEIHRAQVILTGFNLEEAQSFPDNSKVFLNEINRSLLYSTKNEVQVRSLTIDLNKKQIVSRLRELDSDFPFDWIWSCYQANDQACQICESCLRFKRALKV